MQLTIRDLGPIEAVDFPLPATGKIALLGGVNEAGKSTLLRCLMAALTRNRAPISGKITADGAAMVRQVRQGDGSMVPVKRGSVALVDGDSQAGIVWPKGEVVEKGDPLPVVGRIATGAMSLARVDRNARALVLAEVYKLQVGRVELESALAAAGVPNRVTKSPAGGLKASAPTPPLYQQVWDLIEKAGWDKAAETYTDRARMAKGAWNEATGETWGSDKAQGWQPGRWSAELAKADEELLASRVVAAKAARDHVLQVAAATQERLLAAQDAVAELVTLEQARPALAQKAETAMAKASLARKGVDIYPTEHFEPQPCPHCGKPVSSHSDGRLSLPITEEQRKGRAKADAAWRAANDAATAIAADLAAHDRQIATYGRARDDLAALMGLAPATMTRDQADAALVAATDDQTAWLAKQRADAAQRNIGDYLAIAIELAPAGLRGRKTSMVLDTVNGWLEDLSNTMGMGDPVRFASDLTIWRGPLPYEALSESAQWRVDAILQVEIARRQHAPLVLLDRGDVNDADYRDGLISMLVEAGLGCVLTMTFSAPDVMPDLGHARIGSSWWMHEGALMPLAAAGRLSMAVAAE